ncbi:hypothetical protein TNCV_2639801 [Trichonephila clavipes]|nr:hypothetical protein TNCV_2639801 [Trichonephila clavipes]
MCSQAHCMHIPVLWIDIRHLKGKAESFATGHRVLNINLRGHVAVYDDTPCHDATCLRSVVFNRCDRIGGIFTIPPLSRTMDNQKNGLSENTTSVQFCHLRRSTRNHCKRSRHTVNFTEHLEYKSIETNEILVDMRTLRVFSGFKMAPEVFACAPSLITGCIKPCELGRINTPQTCYISLFQPYSQVHCDV